MIPRSIVSAALLASLTAAFPLHAQDVSPQFKRLDRNNDGKLTKDEFSGPLFDQIDTNKDGIITAEEDRAYSRRRPNETPGPRPEAAARIRPTEANIPYAGTDNPRQRLDLFLPAKRNSDKPLPVVVFIHGGGWEKGDKQSGALTLTPLVESGDYIGVSIGYRLSSEVIWPAQIHDCKAAIRWIRGNARKYNLDPDKIGVTGTSAGGHLVAMLGTSGDVTELEGKLGGHLDFSSRVTCVVDQFGPTDFLAMGGWHNEPGSPESKLVGGPIQQTQEAARNASPITYVSKDDPPFLFIHGTKDPAVPFNQSERLHAALVKAGVDSMLVPVPEGGHGGFDPAALAERLRQFFDKHLRGSEVPVATTPIPPIAR